LTINDGITLPGILDIVVTAIRPLGRMVNNPCSNHIQIDIGHASDEMFAIFNRCGMVTVFPEGTFAIFPLIEFLAGTACYQLQRPWQDISVASVNG
jgi:hypothetical protein